MNFLSWDDLAERRTTSRSTEKRRVKKDPRHPRPIQISPGRKAFIEDECDAYDKMIVAEFRAAQQGAAEDEREGAAS